MPALETENLAPLYLRLLTVEVEVSNPTETQSVQVKGQRAMLDEKKSKADWY